MAGVDREIGMMPIDERIVEPDANPLGAERIAEFLYDVAPERGVRDLVVRELRVPEAESLMVFRRKDGVFHSGRLRRLRPLLRIEEVGVEILEILVVFLLADAVRHLLPLAFGRERIEPKVDEHSEAALSPPGKTLGLLRRSLGENPARLFGEERYCQAHYRNHRAETQRRRDV